jgi:hypothetical protein
LRRGLVENRAVEPTQLGAELVEDVFRREVSQNPAIVTITAAAIICW